MLSVRGKHHLRLILPALINEFRNAAKSITISMYIIRLYPDSPENSRTLALLRELVADVILLWDTYGLENVEKAADILGEMTPDNPRRHIGYMVGILKKWGEER